MENPKKFTRQELRSFDGKNGKPAYIAFRGKVYDVTESEQWEQGEHLGHKAGRDLSVDMTMAPHSEDVLDELTVVGILV